MAKKENKSPELSPQKPVLTDEKVAFLTQEVDRFQGLYSEAHAGAQSVFNFYLTFTSTVVGAIIVLLQLSNANLVQMQLTLIGLLLFAVIVGLVYMSALAGRYGHAARYARAIDALRRYLMDELNVPLPQIYQPFLSMPIYREPVRLEWYIWLVPSGTYQLFISLVNSVSLTAIVLMLSHIAGADFARGGIAGVLTFGSTLTIQNTYAHYMIYVLNHRLHVRIDVGRDLALFAGRE